MSASIAVRSTASDAPAYRPMRDADVDAVARVEAELQSHPWTPGNFRDALTAGNSCWIVESGDDIVAYGVLMMGVGEGHLLTLGVARARQRSGLGRAMLEFLMGRAKEFGADKMLLEVRVSNRPARALYDAAGFLEIGLRRNYYATADGREDAIVMGKDL